MGLEILATAAVLLPTYMQYEQGEEQKRENTKRAQAQREANVAQQRQSEVEAQRARIAQAREARIRQAQIVASTGGVSGSSGTAGAETSIGTQAATNIGGIGVTQDFASQISAANQRAADASTRAANAQIIGQQWQAVGQIAQSIFPTSTIFSRTINPAKSSEGK